MTIKTFQIKLPPHLGGGIGILAGGPYSEVGNIATTSFKVNLEHKIKKDADVTLIVPDFSLPSDPKAFDDAVVAAAQALADGKVVVAGCMGGIGRTGTFLAALLGALGADRPIETLRSMYLSHAVETVAQQQFVMNRISNLRSRVSGEVRYRVAAPQTVAAAVSLIDRIRGFFKAILGTRTA
jgi:hypothetical protein